MRRDGRTGVGAVGGAVGPSAGWGVRRAGACVLRSGQVLGVPTDLDVLAASGLISPAGIERARQDLTAPADGPGPGQDESVGDLVRRRLGDEVFDVLVSPLLSGINAGDADRLSLAAGAAQLAAASQMPGTPSLIEALRRQRAAAGAPAPGEPVFRALTGGTQVLTDALAASLRRQKEQLAGGTGSDTEQLRVRLRGYRERRGHRRCGHRRSGRGRVRGGVVLRPQWRARQAHRGGNGDRGEPGGAGGSGRDDVVNAVAQRRRFG